MPRHRLSRRDWQVHTTACCKIDRPLNRISIFSRGTDELLGVQGRVTLINSTLGKALGGAAGHWIITSIKTESTNKRTIVIAHFRRLHNWTKAYHRPASQSFKTVSILQQPASTSGGFGFESIRFAFSG